jgi:hypothetical protein
VKRKAGDGTASAGSGSDEEEEEEDDDVDVDRTPISHEIVLKDHTKVCLYRRIYETS